MIDAAKELNVQAGIELVEASAGTGKTHRITNLLVLLVVERGLPIDQILVVTFTRSATSELKDRVRARLRDASFVLQGTLKGDDEFMRALPARRDSAEDGAEWIYRLQRALLDFDAAPISTIHGFCHRALAQHALSSGVEPALSFLGDAQPVVDRVATDYWIRETWDLHPALFAWLTSDLKVTLRGLVNLGLERGYAPRAIVRPDWVDLPRPYVQPWIEAHARAMNELLEQRDQIVERLVELSPSLKAGYATREKIEIGVAKVEKNLGGLGPFSRITGPTRYLTRASVLAQVRKKAEPFDAAQLDLDVFDAQEAFFAIQEQLGPQIQAWAQALVRRFVDVLEAQLAELRRRTYTQTYGDLLTTLETALGDDDDDPLRTALRQRYRAALIDEFQDTDPVQWAVFRHVFGSGDIPLVLVGDDKQAIYYFRGADVYAYREAREHTARIEQLDTNHRSDEALVHAVNHLFGRTDPPLQTPFADAHIRFEPVLPRHPRRLDFGEGEVRPPFEIRFLRRDEDQGADQWKADESRERVALWLAHDIEKLLADAPELKSGNSTRKLTSGDIAVLVRTHAEGLLAQHTLAERGIASVRHGQDDVFRSHEAKQLRRLLRAMLEPRRRTYVAAALASEIVGLNATELLALQEDEALWESRVAELRQWASTWRARGIGAALREVFDALDSMPRLLAHPDGDRPATNLRHVVELLHGAERTLHLEPAALLRWLEDGIAGMDSEFAAADGPDERQLRLESDADAVKVVTIHASKGLQYPVVFCPSVWAKKPSVAQRHLRFHEDTQTVLDITLHKGGGHEGVAQADREQASEALRMLYVALTRAKHRCVAYWGGMTGMDSSAFGWLLHQRPDRADRKSLAAHLKTLDDEALLAEARESTAGAPEAIVLSECEGLPAPSEAGAAPALEPIPYRPFERDGIDVLWRLSSFSRLAGDARPKPAASTMATTNAATLAPDELVDVQPEDEGVDRDREDELEKPRWSAHREDPACSPLCELPPGKRAGNCLHKIFEHHDFQRPDELEAVVAEQLAAHGFDADELGDTTTHGLQRAIETPLAPLSVALAEVPRARRLDELDFHLRLAPGASGEGITRDEIAAVLEAFPSPGLPEGYHERFGRADLGPLRGMMRGSIDLVFSHENKWYLADYKSTWLGHHVSAYTADAMREPMEHHDYFLQYLIYSVALHRFLQQRLDGYDYDAHFGGSFYLFVRGMSAETGDTTGVFFDPLRRELVEGLADCLVGGSS